MTVAKKFCVRGMRPASKLEILTGIAFKIAHGPMPMFSRLGLGLLMMPHTMQTSIWSLRRAASRRATLVGMALHTRTSDAGDPTGESVSLKLTRGFAARYWNVRFQLPTGD